ncbi:MAG: helix-turn-helix domain-containing protein [Lachnospiraceae bacterium]|nr:helix-turn-helix domain-containing protein [Lachnospiraceae bacterium]MBD5512026.1 helix-turn-helix domain-containing protein [Lachnospiraceae bacterium]
MKLDLLAAALEAIENNLTNDIKTSDIADTCGCSKSTLEKLFRCINHMSVHDYVVRRKMVKAARMITEQPELGILEIALSFGYGSNEAFSRAFKQVWHCNPKDFRKENRYFELFPRLLSPSEPEKNEMEDIYMNGKRPFDISELYDLFTERKNCWFVCCDIMNLIPINEIARTAGDIAILESMSRMNAAAGEDDVVFRIGGDEFALLTASEDRQYAEEIAKKITAQNEQTFTWNDREIPLSLYVGITRLEQNHHIKYCDLFTTLHTSIEKSK